MRYTRVKDKNGEIHLAAFEKEDKVFFLDELFPELKGKSLIDFVHMVNGDPQKAAQMICAADGLVHRIEEQEMLTPIERPVHDILCVGVNYTDHLEETKEHLAGAVSDEVSGTVYFAKRTNRILGANEEIQGRFDIDEKVDYETELAVIIGKEGKGITEEKAEEYVFGYSVFNDLSSRDLQTRHGQWLIAELSKGITLEAGDIIATGTPVVTVFDEKEKPDYEGNKKVIDFLIEGGVDGILVLGSSGEFTGLTKQEKHDFFKFYADYTAGRTKLYAGTGSLNFEDTVALSNEVNEMGYEGAMVIGPCYYALDQEKIFVYYDTLAKSIKGNLYIYNFPARSGHSIAPETLKKLVENNTNIKGLKDSVSEPNHTNELMPLYDMDSNFSLLFKKLMQHRGVEISDRAIFPYNQMDEEVYKKAESLMDKVIEEYQNLK